MALQEQGKILLHKSIRILHNLYLNYTPQLEVLRALGQGPHTAHAGSACTHSLQALLAAKQLLLEPRELQAGSGDAQHIVFAGLWDNKKCSTSGLGLVTGKKNSGAHGAPVPGGCAQQGREEGSTQGTSEDPHRIQQHPECPQ